VTGRLGVDIGIGIDGDTLAVREATGRALAGLGLRQAGPIRALPSGPGILRRTVLHVPARPADAHPAAGRPDAGR
jgi:hypothetical protein